MNEKEKKAIERCNQLRQVEHANWIGISNQLAIITVLNLIEKQQAEIEKKDKIIDEMAEYLSIIRDCPNEDCGANLDCENRCSNDDSIYAECWKMYFNLTEKIEKMLEEYKKQYNKIVNEVNEQGIIDQLIDFKEISAKIQVLEELLKGE